MNVKSGNDIFQHTQLLEQANFLKCPRKTEPHAFVSADASKIASAKVQ